MKRVFTLFLITFLLTQVFASTATEEDSSKGCEQLIEHTLVNQIETASLFDNTNPLFVAIVCSKDSQSIYSVLQGQMYAPEVIAKSSPVVSLTTLKQTIDPNGDHKTTGILSVDKQDQSQFTLNLRTRLATGEAIDIRKQAQLALGQFTIFEQKGLVIGFVRLPVTK